MREHRSILIEIQRYRLICVFTGAEFKNKIRRKDEKKKRKERTKLLHILLSSAERMNESRKDPGPVPESPIIASANPG